MLWILAIIIILYVSSHIFLRNNATFLRVRKWVDIATLVVTSALVIAWVEVFGYSFFILVYFFVSLAIIVTLVIKLRSAQTTVEILRDEEELLEEELQKEKNEKI
ncbi:hypothetical protein ISR94_02905 [Candidatus Microgenomates bacterium]|nr:hypothetical protein [Candidatus Microgenomates bacterium]